MTPTDESLVPGENQEARLHALVTQHQQLSVDGAGQMQRRQQVREAAGDVFAAARIEPGPPVPLSVAATHRLHADAVPFPFGGEVGSVEAGEIAVFNRSPERTRR